MNSTQDLESFYQLLSELSSRLGGYRYLRDCDGRSGWPSRGVYFFLDEQEPRSSGDGLRVVRVGTHALRLGSQTSLWGRLSQHKGHESGQHPGGGNHRGSVFRYHEGATLLIRDGDPADLLPSWMGRLLPSKETKELEYEVERRVSRYIGNLPFLWIGVPDQAGPASDRGLIERNFIGLLSVVGRELDPPRQEWLGHQAPSSAIGRSGLWNVDHVGYGFEVASLNTLDRYVSQM